MNKYYAIAQCQVCGGERGLCRLHGAGTSSHQSNTCSSYAEFNCLSVPARQTDHALCHRVLSPLYETQRKL